MDTYTTKVLISVKCKEALIAYFERTMDLPFNPCLVNDGLRIGIDVNGKDISTIVSIRGFTGWSETNTMLPTKKTEVAHIPYILDVKLPVPSRRSNILKMLKTDLRYKNLMKLK